MIGNIIRFTKDFTVYALKGGIGYYIWLLFLSALSAGFAYGFTLQLANGLIVTGMNDVISWGLYEAQFVFLVGVAAAAVTTVFPPQVYHYKHLKNVSIIGEMLAISAVTMCLLFIFLHLGRIDRVWHMLPVIGIFNFPDAMLTWDVIVLNGYLGLNALCAFYYLYKKYTGEPINEKFYTTFVYIAILWAPSIHIVTAFLINTMPARPMWFHSLMPIKFIATAFAGGICFIILTLFVVNKTTKLKIPDEAINLLSQVATWCLGLTVSFLIFELVTELYHGTEHADSLKYLLFGKHGLTKLVPWIWTSIVLTTVAFFLMINPNFRKNHKKLPIACVMVFVGIWIDKGMGLVVPAYIPSPVGELAEYYPTVIEVMNSVGVWAFGLLMFTVLSKGSIGMMLGEVKHPNAVGKDSGHH